jgi:hypothetical protein
MGAFTIGLSKTSVVMIMGLGIFALGSGYNFFIRSLLASVVENDHIGMLYTMISIFETVGVLVAGPLLAVSFRIGMDWGGMWLGLPYIAAWCLFAVAATVVSSIGLSRPQSKVVDLSMKTNWGRLSRKENIWRPSHVQQFTG